MSNPLVMRVLLAVILLVCAVGAFLARAERAEVTIRIAFLASSDDEDYVGAMAFKESVEAAAGGRVSVQVFPSGQYCGSERECIEALQGGMLEMHQTTFGGLAALFGPAQALDLPYTFADDAVAECVMDGPLLAQMGDAILEQGLGLRLMAVGNTGGWRSFATTRQRIQSPADLARLRIRTLPSALEQEMVRALGANPTPLPWSEVYYALSAGLLDGTKNSVQDVVGMKLHEHVRFLFVDRHSYMGAMWWYSERQWQALPPDLKPIVAEGFRVLAIATREAAAARQGPAFEAFRVSGGVVDEVTPEQREAFREATRGLRDWYAKRYGAEWLERLDAAVAACEQSNGGER
ncbi:MAG TPA: TRAP transporter substrate-binding protein DctP [Steroidobacteraceae bacterium]|nr:TRAP transporter substrate-binding protein DctP [Steroidobacteraceae bacterium]